ncbi:tyrosine-protein kinase ABL1 [Platysternon megacephalum]|uniref:Tyrosine-protein kinase ABL1 n=1 Tax=Platysternon megacephalum TaxID=55544 RepID=A0A4D9EB62_9SAUR|nr:tyrosine-protein kinase ABL1 [Platysternon megacephalum]
MGTALGTRFGESGYVKAQRRYQVRLVQEKSAVRRTDSSRQASVGLPEKKVGVGVLSFKAMALPPLLPPLFLCQGKAELEGRQWLSPQLELEWGEGWCQTRPRCSGVQKGVGEENWQFKL